MTDSCRNRSAGGVALPQPGDHLHYYWFCQMVLLLFDRFDLRFRAREELPLENPALRQQLLTLHAQHLALD